MFKPIIVGAVLCSLAACSNHYEPLPMVKSGDPVFQLNTDRRTDGVNDLMAAPGDGAPRLLPAPSPLSSSEARVYE